MDDWYFPRPALARHYLHVLSVGIVSNLAIFAPRRKGKSLFLLKDLSPAAQVDGYIPIYTSLWHNSNAPHEVIISSLENALRAVSKRSRLTNLLTAQVNKTTVGNEVLGKVEIEFARNPQPAPSRDLLRMESLLGELEERAGKKRLLFMIDEIQHLATSEVFNPVAYALRTALDKRSDRVKGIFTGSSRHYLNLLFNRSEAPFYNFVENVPFPDLGEAFIDHLCTKLEKDYGIIQKPAELSSIFERLDHSPFWMLKVINHLITSRPNLDEAYDKVRQLITLAEGLEELAQTLKPIDKIVFLAIAEGRSPFTQEVLSQIDRQTRYKGVSSNVQKSIQRLKNNHVISQYGRGDYYVEKPGLADYLKTVDVGNK